MKVGDHQRGWKKEKGERSGGRERKREGGVRERWGGYTRERERWGSERVRERGRLNKREREREKEREGGKRCAKIVCLQWMWTLCANLNERSHPSSPGVQSYGGKGGGDIY